MLAAASTDAGTLCRRSSFARHKGLAWNEGGELLRGVVELPLEPANVGLDPAGHRAAKSGRRSRSRKARKTSAVR